eukprot:1361499-Pyramimonas_sp.AAC.1
MDTRCEARRSHGKNNALDPGRPWASWNLGPTEGPRGSEAARQGRTSSAPFVPWPPLLPCERRKMLRRTLGFAAPPPQTAA